MVIVVVAMTVTMVLVTVIAVIFIATVIAVVVVIPLVAVLDTAVGAFPITVVEPFSIVAWADPAGSLIRRAAPIAFMPTVMSLGGIPVAAYPDEFGRRLCGDNGDDAGFGWRPDADSDRYLRAGGDTD